MTTELLALPALNPDSRIFPLPPHQMPMARWKWPLRVMPMRLWAKAFRSLEPVGQMGNRERFFVRQAER